jgi:hypothetical protein
MGDYQYPISQCDVKDSAKLEIFRRKRREWISWLKSDDPHSIWPQINQLLWDDVLFRTVNDLRREATEHPTEEVAFNGNVLRLLDAGFVTTQATAIRRLTDKPTNDPKKGVLSLRRLIKDIKEHRETITREVYVSYDGLPYDPDGPRQAWIEKQIKDGAISRVSRLPTTGPEAWDAAELVHENFDRLAGVAPDGRTREDLILPKWFEYVESRLKDCDAVRKFIGKFIAHAADPVSRRGLSAEETEITLDRLRHAQKSIYQVAAFIYGRLLWEGSYGAVPIPQYDHLENLDKRWVVPERCGFAHDCWNCHLKVVEEWEQEDLWPVNE